MIWIELRKAIRSKVPVAVTITSTFMPLGIAFLIFVSRNPELSIKLGLISTKANLMTYSGVNWSSYSGFLGQIVAAAGFLFSIMIISWVFGREFADATLKDMLAVPVRRSSIILAKFIVAAIWSVVVTMVISIVGLVMGAIIKLPGGSISVISQGSALIVIITCLTIPVVMPFALFASVGRGYLLPIGIAVLTLMTTNLMAIVGWSEYFPWAVPMLYAQGTLTPVSYWIVLLTGLAGMIATYLWWKYADQNR